MCDYVKNDIQPTHKIQTLSELYKFCKNEVEHEWQDNAGETFNSNPDHLRAVEGVCVCTYMIDIENTFPGKATFTWKDPTHAICCIEIEITRTTIQGTDSPIKLPDTRIVIQFEFENTDTIDHKPATSEYIVKHRKFTWTYYLLIDDDVLHYRTVEVADDKLDKLMSQWDKISTMPVDSVTEIYDKDRDAAHHASNK